jgi:hypothetical protein
MNMLEYSKIILEKVSFDRKLFEKELKKALRQLVGKDREELTQWATTRFGYGAVSMGY